MEDRRLFQIDVPPTEAPRGWEGRYFVYKCVRPSMGWGMDLPKSKSFQKDTCVYGDMIVFKRRETQKDPYNQNSRRLFAHMKPQAVESFRDKGFVYKRLEEVAKSD